MTNYPIGPHQTTIYIILPLHVTLRTGRPICRRVMVMGSIEGVKTR